jgi:hypothetical protein
MRKRRPLTSWSETKSSDQRGFGCTFKGGGVLVPEARLLGTLAECQTCVCGEEQRASSTRCTLLTWAVLACVRLEN